MYVNWIDLHAYTPATHLHIAIFPGYDGGIRFYDLLLRKQGEENQKLYPILM